MTEEQYLDNLAAEGKSLPEWWGDPIARAKELGHSITAEILDAHLCNFEQAYGNDTRLGSHARAVGDLRNVDGQGMPGEKGWRNEVRSGERRI